MTRTQELTRTDIAVYGLTMVLVLVGVVLSRVDLEAFENRYAVEDGPVQWLTVVGFALGGIVCLRRAVVLWGRRPARFLAVTVLMGLGLIFCAGEEISWGQRVFGVETPEWLKEHNAQEETNLHNLRIGEVKINKLVFSWGVGLVGALYFCVLSPLYGTKPRFADRVDGLGVPVPKTHHIIAVLTMLALTQVATTSTNKGEMAEFGGAMIVLLILLYPTNRANFIVASDEGNA